MRGREKDNQKAEKTTSINIEASTQTKSQLKQHKWTISISAVSAREHHAVLVSVSVLIKRMLKEAKAGGKRRLSREKNRSMFDRWILQCPVNAEERWEPAYLRSDSEGWLVSSQR